MECERILQFERSYYKLRILNTDIIVIIASRAAQTLHKHYVILYKLVLSLCRTRDNNHLISKIITKIVRFRKCFVSINEF